MFPAICQVYNAKKKITLRITRITINYECITNKKMAKIIDFFVDVCYTNDSM